jgi:hypothetical protein
MYPKYEYVKCYDLTEFARALTTEGLANRLLNAIWIDGKLDRGQILASQLTGTAGAGGDIGQLGAVFRLGELTVVHGGEFDLVPAQNIFRTVPTRG